MLLSFFDYYWDDDYVDNKFLDSSTFECNQSVETIPAEPPLPFEIESPGTKSEKLFETDVTQISDEEYINFINTTRETYLQSYLSAMANEMFGKINGLSLYEATHLAMYYLIYRRNITNNRAVVTCYDGHDKSELKEYIVNNVSDGIPVLVNITSSLIGSHACVAYDYDSISDKLYVHCGWNQGSATLTHVPLNSIGTDYESIDSALAIVPTSSDYSCNNEAYVANDGRSISAFNFVLPTNLKAQSESYIDIPQTFIWDSLYKERWVSDCNPYINIKITSIDGETILETRICDGYEYQIPSQTWHYINFGYPDDFFVVSVSLASDVFLFPENHCSLKQRRPDKTFSYDPISIQSDVFSVFGNRYASDETSKSIFTTHRLEGGFTFKTRRHRAGFIEKECLVLSPKRKGFNEAFVEFQFIIPVDRIDIDLSYWRDPKVEGLTKENGKAVIEEHRYGSYDTAHPLLNLLDEKAQLPTNRKEMQTYKLRFSKPLTRIRVYACTFETNNNKDNKGRICIGNIKVFESRAYKFEGYGNMAPSGGEPEYEPEKWNGEDVVEGNNCYNYALNYQVENGPTDPGSMAEFSTLKTLLADQSRYKAYFDAGFFFLAVRADSYYGKPKEFGFVFNEIDRDDELIGDDRYRVALAFGRSVYNDKLDYHWYRQNKDGTWSHKPGKGAVRNFDLDGNPIMDPHYCNRRTNEKIVSDVNGGWESEYLSKVSYYTVKWNTEEYEYEEGYIDSDWLSQLGSNEL